MTTETLKINFQRLKQDIEHLSEIGRNTNQGIYRMAFTHGDIAGRNWLIERIHEAKLTYHQDGAANIFAHYGQTDTASIMTGSHIDTVPGAGHLDGALGVICGLEALRVISEQNIKLSRSLELVAFSDEEGRFGGMFGSQSLIGEITPEWIHSARDLSGITLVDAMKEHGLDAMDALSAARSPSSIDAYVELHIEQGPVLDSAGIPVGIVEAICGLRRWEVRLIGIANHAGTTPMSMRNDAFQGLAEFASEIDRVIEEHGSELSVATIGRVELVPGAANVVPEEARFSLEFRDTDTDILDALSDAFRRTLSAIARRRKLMFEFELLSDIAPVSCNENIQETIAEVATQLDCKTHVMPSGAAHDAQKLAGLTRAGMIFVPSKAGRSHSAAEWTSWDDIHKGANVLLNTLYRLASGETR